MGAVVQQLLERNADVGAKDNYERMALLQAAGWGREVVARLLLERNADVEDEG